MDSEWNWINKNPGQYDYKSVRNIFAHERIRVTFSDKMDENTESSSDGDKKLTNESNDENKQKRASKEPEREIDNPHPSEKPEKGNDAQIEKDKPEIRYEVE